jgi:hypothetical protein
VERLVKNPNFTHYRFNELVFLIVVIKLYGLYCQYKFAGETTTRMFNINSKPARPWRVVAAEVFRESDPSACLRLVEELNRAIAQQGLESGASLKQRPPWTEMSIAAR